MEMQHIGQRCGVVECKQLDFLPFTCAACGIVTCLEHHKFEAHECSNAYKLDNVVPECPLCGCAINVPAGGDANIAMEAHISAGCPQSDEPKGKIKKCSWPGCRDKTTVIPIICKECRKGFCTAHRFPDNHSCPPFLARGGGSQSLNLPPAPHNKPKILPPGQPENFLRASKPSKAVNSLEELREARLIKLNQVPDTSSRGSRTSPPAKLSSSSSSASPSSLSTPQGSPTPKTVPSSKAEQRRQVALMKLKSKAKGNNNLPADQRFYLEIDTSGCQEVPASSSPKAMFWSKSTTIGRVIDDISNTYGIKNTNNIASAQEVLVIANKSNDITYEPDAVLEFLSVCNMLSSGDCISIIRKPSASSKPSSQSNMKPISVSS